MKKEHNKKLLNRLVDFFHDFKYDCWSLWDDFVNIFTRLGRCIDYAIFAWKDVEWDERTFYRLLKFKIRRHRKSMETSYYSNRDKYCRQMYITELVLDRLEKDAYFDSLFDLHIKKWGEQETEWLPSDFGSTMVLKYANAKTEEQKAQQEKDSREMFEKEEYMKKQDFDYLLLRIRKYLKNWST